MFDGVNLNQEEIEETSRTFLFYLTFKTLVFPSLFGLSTILSVFAFFHFSPLFLHRTLFNFYYLPFCEPLYEKFANVPIFAKYF